MSQILNYKISLVTYKRLFFTKSIKLAATIHKNKVMHSCTNQPAHQAHKKQHNLIRSRTVHHPRRVDQCQSSRLWAKKQLQDLLINDTFQTLFDYFPNALLSSHQSANIRQYRMQDGKHPAQSQPISIHSTIYLTKT